MSAPWRDPLTPEQRRASFTWTRDGKPAQPQDDAAILRDLKAQVKRLRRSKVYPNQVRWPADRKVFVQVMTRDIGRSFRMGEVLQPLMVYLDAPPEWTRELNPDPAMGSIIPASGTTGYLRVR